MAYQESLYARLADCDRSSKSEVDATVSQLGEVNATLFSGSVRGELSIADLLHRRNIGLCGGSALVPALTGNAP